MIEEWKIPSIQSASLPSMGNLHIFMFFKHLTKLPCFTNGKNYRVNKKAQGWWRTFSPWRRKEWSKGHVHAIKEWQPCDNFWAPLSIVNPSHDPLMCGQIAKLEMLEWLDSHLTLSKLKRKEWCASHGIGIREFY